MKTAIIITGHMRSFERCLPTLHWHVFRHFPGADFFVSTIDDENAAKAGLLRVKYPGARVEIEAVKEQPDCIAEMRAKGIDLPKEWQRGKPYTHEPYAISVHPQSVLRQLWQLEQGWKLYCAKADGEFSMIIRCRPDLWFHSLELPESRPLFQSENRLLVFTADTACTPWWGQFGGINDRFAILGPQAAARYFQAYSRVQQLMEQGCPLHPESLIAAALEGSELRPLIVEFSTLREKGEMRAPEYSWPDLARLRS